MSLASNDLLSGSMTRIATTASKQRKLVAVACVILLAIALAVSLYLTKRGTFRAQASEALFKARNTLAAEMKVYSNSVRAATPVPAKVDPKSKTPIKPAAKIANPAALSLATFDVDAKLHGSVESLEKVAHDFPGTLPGFDAKMDLGGLYFDHSVGAASFEKAAKWFDSAANSAPGKEQTTAALYSLGYAQEALGRCADAVKSFDRAYHSGSGLMAGELLRSKARCQETLGDKAAAKTTYEQMVKTLPNTDAARFAETKKASL
ncbi:MAG: tetratricopeptide repeat protein [Cryobacterium sp.]|nr:tetratricopeptide repeat protein [Oligoflexia bacterium]